MHIKMLVARGAHSPQARSSDTRRIALWVRITLQQQSEILHPVHYIKRVSNTTRQC